MRLLPSLPAGRISQAVDLRGVGPLPISAHDPDRSPAGPGLSERR